MATSAENFGIIVAVDGSPGSDAAVTWAAAEGLRRKVPVTLLHVIAPLMVTWSSSAEDSNIADLQADSSASVLERAEVVFRSALDDPNAVVVRVEPRPSPVVGTLAEASRAALMLVVGNRGTGGHKRLPLGSVAAGLLHHAHSPVVVIHQDDVAEPTAPVVLGVDGSPSSEAATRVAFEEAALRGVDLVARTPGVISGRRRCSPWTGGCTRRRRRRHLPNDSPGGRSSIPVCACSAAWCATDPRTG